MAGNRAKPCRATIAVEGEPCTAWREDGHPWHGCDDDIWQHRDRPHRCKCGVEWDGLIQPVYRRAR